MRRSSRLACAAALMLVLWHSRAAERETAVQLNSRGMELYRAGRFQEAEALYREALDLPSPHRASILVNLGEVLRARGLYRQAEPPLLESVSLLEGAVESESTNLAHALCSLSAVYRSEGKLDRAEKTGLRAARTGTEKDRADARLCLASVYIEQGRYADAESLVRNMEGSAQGVSAAVLYNNMAAAANARRDFLKAEDLARRAMASLQQAGGQAALTATIFNSIAQSCRFQGKYVDAEANYRQAIQLWQEALGPAHPDVARGLMNMAAFYHERGRDAGAEELYRRAASIFEKSLGERHLDTLIARNELSDVLRAEHRYVEAERLSKASIEPLKTLLLATDPRLGRALFHYAELLHETKRQKEAEVVLQAVRASR